MKFSKFNREESGWKRLKENNMKKFRCIHQFWMTTLHHRLYTSNSVKENNGRGFFNNAKGGGKNKATSLDIFSTTDTHEI